MLEDPIYGIVVFYHFLVMAAALLMGSSAYRLAHHSVEVPFPSVFATSFDHIFEFEEEGHILFVFLITPVGSRESFLTGGLIFKTEDNPFRPEDPGLNFVSGHAWGKGVLGLCLGQFREGKHGALGNKMRLKILLNSI